MVGDWGHTGINDLFNEIVSGLVLHLSNNVWHDGVYGSGEGVSLVSSLSLLLISIATWSWDPSLGWLKAPLGTNGVDWDSHSSDLSEVSILVDRINSEASFLLLLSGNSISKVLSWVLGIWVIDNSTSWSWDPSLGWLKAPSGSDLIVSNTGGVTKSIILDGGSHGQKSRHCNNFHL